MKKLFVVFAIGFSALACGNPVKMEKDLKDNEEGRKAAETELKDKTAENRHLRNQLAGVFATTKNVWVFADVFANYEQALQVCANLKYSLPTRDQFNEFWNEAYLKLPTERQFQKAEQFHVLGETQTLTEGLVMCRKPAALGEQLQ
jgi:hypothetical protein